METALALGFLWLLVLTICFIAETADTARLRKWAEETREWLDKRLTTAENDLDAIKDNGRRLLKKARRIWEEWGEL